MIYEEVHRLLSVCKCFTLILEKTCSREEKNKEREVEAATTGLFFFNREQTSLNVKAIIAINSKCLITILYPDLLSTPPSQT